MLETASAKQFDRNFPILSIRNKAVLQDLAAALFAEEGSCTDIGIDSGRLNAFVGAVCKHYRNNPYHNFHHAVDTINTTAWMLSRPGLRNRLPVHHRYLLMLAALVHDAGHPGHNNQWEVATGSELALRYNNKSVIENYSLDITFGLTAESSLNVLADRSGRPIPDAGEILTDLILATDFAMHRSFLDEFQARLAQGPLNPDEWESRSLLSRAIIKAADIANTSKRFSQAKFWGYRVMKEFWNQGQQEKRHNLPVGPLNDQEAVSLNAAQAGFIKFAALELFDLLARVDEDIGEMSGSLRRNLELYERLAESD